MLHQTTIHRLFAMGVAIGLSSLLYTNAAVAEKRVVLLKIEGDASSRIGKSLSKLIDNEHRIIDGSTYELQARKLNANRLNARDVRKVASKIEADGILSGTMLRRRGRYVLQLRLIEGSSGRTIKKLSVKLRSRRLSRKMRKAIAERLLSAIDELAIVENTSDAIREEDGDAKRARVRKTARDDDEGDKIDEDDKGDKGDSVADDDKPSRSAAAPSGGSVDKSLADAAKPPGDAMSIAAGLSVISRKLSFTSRADLAEPPAGYNGPLAPGIYANGELYPLAMDGKGKGGLTNLGIGFTIDRVVSINTVLQDPNGGMNVTLPTSQTQWGVHVKYRYKFNDKENSPVLKASVGYNRMTFEVDRTGLEAGQILDLPNTSYTYYDPGLALRYPVSPKLAVEVDARAMLVTGVGQMQTPEQYGSAKVTGVDGGISIEYKLKPKVVLNIGARYMAIGYQFNGDGMQTNARDDDPNTVDVGGALDSYMRAYVALGYLF